MARKFTMVQASLWRSKRLRAVESNEARLLYVYLLTCPFSNSIGVFDFDPGYAAVDMPYLPDPEKLLAQLEAVDLIRRAGDTLMITQYSRFSPVVSWQHAVSAINDCLAIGDPGIRLAVAEDIASGNGFRELEKWRNAKGEPHNALVKFYEVHSQRAKLATIGGAKR